MQLCTVAGLESFDFQGFLSMKYLLRLLKIEILLLKENLLHPYIILLADIYSYFVIFRAKHKSCLVAFVLMLIL